jgi:hypothetical protein
MDDPDIIGEHPAIREIHAIRLMIYDETKDLTPDEHTAYFRKGAERVIAGGCVADKARK